MGWGILAALTGPPRKAPILVVDDVRRPADRSAYLELASKAGFDGAEVAIKSEDTREESLRLRRFLSENGITVYDPRKVSRYMDSITPKYHRWQWIGLKSGDYRRPYTKPIPEAVLLTMAKIREAFPDVVFNVTDITEAPKGDPFLRCGLQSDDEWYIIERWDEPTFRG